MVFVTLPMFEFPEVVTAGEGRWKSEQRIKEISNFKATGRMWNGKWVGFIREEIQHQEEGCGTP